MPTLTAVADVAKAQVRLDLDFTDICAPYAYVTRVDAITGASTAVRGHGSSTTISGLPYVPLLAGYQGVLYDTECPLDASVYYVATAPSVTMNATSTFEGGYLEPWYRATPASATLRLTANSSGQNFMSFSGDGSVASPTIRGNDVPALPGASFTTTCVVSLTGANGVTAGMSFLDSTGAILTSPSNAAVVLAATTISATGVAPASTVAVRPFVQIQGTPPASLLASVSSFTVTNAAGSAVSRQVTLPSLSSGWLKDPLRPGNNVPIGLTFDPNPQCIPTEGVFWQSMDVEGRASNSAVFNVNNQAEPTVTSKVRSSMTSTLTLVSRTFADRDRLNALLAPGTPVLLQVPAGYGVSDMYLSVGASSVGRVLPDHRFPIRVFSLPFSSTSSPGGPMQGTVGARWGDVCKTWAAVSAAGLTWYQLLDGMGA